MISARQRAWVACVPIAGICLGAGVFAGAAIESSNPEAILDNTILVLLPGVIFGLLAARVGQWLAAHLKGHNAGLVLVETEKIIQSHGWLLFAALVLLSRAAAVVAVATAWGAWYGTRGLQSEERWRLNDLFGSRRQRD